MSKQGYSRNLDLVPVRLGDRCRNEATQLATPNKKKRKEKATTSIDHVLMLT